MNAQKGMVSLLVALALAACAPKGDALYARAEKSLEAGDQRAAIIDLKNLVKDEPSNGKARALLARALLRDGDVGAASIEVDKARQLGASAEMLLVPECGVMASQRRFTEVLEKCASDDAAEGDQPDIYISRGRALAGLDRHQEAKAEFEAALKARPGSIEALLGIASAAYALDGLPAAKVVLEQASEQIRGRAAYWLALGDLSLRGGDFPAAEQAFATAFERAAGVNEDRIAALIGKTESQMRQAKIKEALATSEQLIKLSPNNPMLKQLRGQVLAADGQVDQARELLEDAVASMPDNNQARLLLGLVNLQSGNVGQAEMHFANVVAKDPENAVAVRLLAEAKSQIQSPDKSLESLKAAVDLGSANPSVLATAARLSLASGDRKQALQYLAEAEAASEESPSLQVRLEIASGYLAAGEVDHALQILEAMPQGGATGYQREYLMLTALLRKGEQERALAEAKALTERAGDDPQVRNLVAAVYAAAGQKDAGREQFNEALRLKPNDPEALVNLARLDLAEGKSADAEKNLLKVLETEPGNLVATLGLAAVAAARGDAEGAERWLQKANVDHPESVSAQIALVQYYVGAREFGKAKAFAGEAAKRSPNSAFLANAYGLALLGAKDTAGAIASFRRATEIAPGDAGIALNLARAHLANRDLDSALGVINGVLKDDPDNATVLLFGAATSLAAGRVEAAAGYTARLQRAAPDSAATSRMEGDLAMVQKRYRDALSNYQKAAAKAPDSRLVLAQYRAAELAGSPSPEKVLDEWLQAHPNDGNIAVALADARQRKGDVDGAIRSYEQALARSPDNVIVLNNLAVLYDAKGDPKASQFAERAYKGRPDSPAIQDTYGWILFRQGKTDQALELLRKSYEGLPQNAEVQYHLAAALAKKGDTAEAVTLLKKALNGPLPASQAAAAQKLLQQLSK